MAAAAGAPGSGDGGETAEPDSEPIPGDGRLEEQASEPLKAELQTAPLSGEAPRPASAALESNSPPEHGKQAGVRLDEQGLSIPSVEPALLCEVTGCGDGETDLRPMPCALGASAVPGAVSEGEELASDDVRPLEITKREDAETDCKVRPQKAEVSIEEEPMQWKDELKRECGPMGPVEKEPELMELEGRPRATLGEVDILPSLPPEDIERGPSPEEGPQGASQNMDSSVDEGQQIQGPMPEDVELVGQSAPEVQPTEELEPRETEDFANTVTIAIDPERDLDPVKVEPMEEAVPKDVGGKQDSVPMELGTGVISEGVAEVQPLCEKAEHTEAASEFQERITNEVQQIHGAGDEACQTTQPLQQSEQQDQEPAGGGPCVSVSVPGNAEHEAVLIETATVCGQVNNSEKEGLESACKEMGDCSETIHSGLNLATAEENGLQFDGSEGSSMCDSFSEHEGKCLDPDLVMDQPMDEPEVESHESHLITHKTELQSQVMLDESQTRSTQVNNDVNYDTFSKDIETSCETQKAEDASRDGACTSGVTSRLPPSPINTESHTGNISDCLQTGFANRVSLYRDPNVEQISVEINHVQPSSENRETVVEEPNVSLGNTGCDGGPEQCTGDPERPDALPNAEKCLDDPENVCAARAKSVDPFAIGGVDGLVLGSEVRVTLDHIIQDALVVSFHHGNRIFSGVLMDLSKRFGPHGIPVTVHPKREYKNKPEEPAQLQSPSFQEETQQTSEENGKVSEDVAPVQSSEPEPCTKAQNMWTSKPPPLFHEGAPYPPPLFIRDTYNQSIPQPPPRKIKRLKKKIYREEPTSIMNAIKLRPRQVLCDKCKNVVSDKRDIRKSGNDSFKPEDGKRRRHESVSTVNKKLKTDHKINGKSQNESQKRNAVAKVSNLNHGRGKVVKVGSQASSGKTQLHGKKVLQSKNMDHAKAREVLKMAKEKAHKRKKDTSSSKNTRGKVHFTRRLQNTSSGTLPPRLRIKPQRYRNEENDSSLKTGLESLRSSKMSAKPQTRYSATRSAGEVPSEIKSPSNGPEEAGGDVQDTSVCVPTDEQDEQQTLSKRGSKSNSPVYMTLNQAKADSSSASVCSSDSTDDLKSSHSECSSTENFDFPPGSIHAPSPPSSSSKEEKRPSNSLKIKVFSKNVSKCVTPDGRTICVGDIVWAKIYGFPWWPARILTITVSRKDNGLLVRQEARISWFGSPTTSFLALSQLSPFLENFQSRFNKKRKGLYRKAITEAAKAAKQLTPEVRALLTQFET
ncbi:PWWP domain-containing protein 2A [Spea bombifrons]|uniref:PWWP domain-containing protein 2A n=1 Tax=Spea bombifrons TaxID=233779 RepID=UPI00234A3660|nr:PWWP domain-containing protein 2A [Spea bombifrons]